jgi:hypothetical protein
MACGLVRLICEDPSDSWQPPEGQQGRALVVDVRPEDVASTVARLKGDGWQFISEWQL